MHPPWERVQLFVSSTFGDMHAERDYLVKRVFPVVRDWCERRRLLFVDVDLRWGIREEPVMGGDVVSACLRRIDECRPLFLGLVGHRYGSVPSLETMPPTTFKEFPGLKAELARKISLTELEIIHALVRPLHGRDSDLRRMSGLFYLREESSLAALPFDPILRRSYTDSAEPGADERACVQALQEHLRTVLIPKTGAAVRRYTATWDPDLATPELALPLKGSPNPRRAARWRSRWADMGLEVGETGLEVSAESSESACAINRRLTTGRFREFRCGRKSLAARIIDDLKRLISQHFPRRAELIAKTGLDEELERQERFIVARSEGFVSRPGDFAPLDSYVAGSSSRPLAIGAPRGSGKTTLLANWINGIDNSLTRDTGRSVHFRFAGANEGSATIDSVLTSLLAELRAIGKLRESVPEDPADLRRHLPDLLRSAARNGPIAVVIDGIDQIDGADRDMGWLPEELPTGVKLIVSYALGDGEVNVLWNKLRATGRVLHSSVSPFSLEDRRRLVGGYLARYLKDLDDDDLEALVHIKGAGIPLFLGVVLHELRVFGSHDAIADKIGADFGETPESAFAAVLRRLESDPPYASVPTLPIVARLFGFLSHARAGLSMEELVQLIQSTAADITNGSAAESGGAPIASRIAVEDAVLLLLRQVRPFVTQRTDRISFSYESFLSAARDRYGAPGETPQSRSSSAWHEALARYFDAFSAPGTWKRPDARHLDELFFHAVEGRLVDRCIALFSDPHLRRRYIGARGPGRYIHQFQQFEKAAERGADLLPAVEALAARIEINEEMWPLVRGLARLVATDAASAGHFLLECVDRSDPSIRTALAIRALYVALHGSGSEPGSIPVPLRDRLADALPTLLRHRERRVRWEAAYAYWTIAPGGGIDPLLRCAEAGDEHPIVRAEAARQLGKADNPDLLPHLRRLAQSSFYPLSAFAARSARRIELRLRLTEPGTLADWSQPSVMPADLESVLADIGARRPIPWDPESDRELPLLIHYVEDDVFSVEGTWKEVEFLETVLRRLPCRLVCSEAAVGDVSLMHLRAYRTLEDREDIAVRYLQDLLLHANEYLNVASDFDCTIWGVDHERTYIRISQAKHRGERGLADVASIERASCMLDGCIEQMNARRLSVAVLLTKQLPAYQIQRLLGARADPVMDFLLPRKVRIPEHLVRRGILRYVEVRQPHLRGDLFELDINYAICFQQASFLTPAAQETTSKVLSEIDSRSADDSAG